ncbi:hypothetical protein BE17_47790 [Sorangium cellulosum]|uniref:Uncharacterized protein n=1 Tax=Sorangium cellulosum TaxID=56 RepID=A0A150S1C3_SORCE|nr:hypothetical protein BE17_47790 [Sorangium cellulosum]
MNYRAQINVRRASSIAMVLLLSACSRELGDGPWAGAAGGPTRLTGEAATPARPEPRSTALAASRSERAEQLPWNRQIAQPRPGLP